ncbi:MAG: hypothetical protein QF412_08090 [Planctomycetota bacterium]|jgi:hypothetical protein|nr:hypothetical protein [Planctomycetota bacterium]
MATELKEAVDRVLLGEPLRVLVSAYREELLISDGLDPQEAEPMLRIDDAHKFIARVCRHLGERHAGDERACVALRDWAAVVDDYDAYDALLTGFQFEGRNHVLEKGRLLFPRMLTSHWDQEV